MTEQQAAFTEAEALYEASKLVEYAWFRGVVWMARNLDSMVTTYVEEANIDITLEEGGDDRGDVITYARVHGNAYTDGVNVYHDEERITLTETEKYA